MIRALKLRGGAEDMGTFISNKGISTLTQPINMEAKDVVQYPSASSIITSLIPSAASAQTARIVAL